MLPDRHDDIPRIDGAIDYDFYRRRAARLRREAIRTAAGRPAAALSRFLAACWRNARSAMAGAPARQS
ncbi:MAG: hypothetical protein BGP06_14005 [Rhizobiales bacterium 65-9]|nr:hypothetical protein [Hyphomicrobiales bacterium]OJY36795.1 MAG: hypothetical protein BGP06_14005 [Rhizobiales bacterium 65-9]